MLPSQARIQAFERGKANELKGKRLHAESPSNLLRVNGRCLTGTTVDHLPHNVREKKRV